MRRRLSGLALTLATVGLMASGHAAPAQQTARGKTAVVDPPTVIGMRAHLFQNKRGVISEDVLAKPGGLANTIAGPDSANATLIVVEVSGAPGGTYTGYFGPSTDYRARLVAQEEGRKPRLLLNQTQRIPVLSDKGRVYLSYLVHQSGCAPVRLTATIVGARAGKPFERTLDLACGA
jgi:hypothetical protein